MFHHTTHLPQRLKSEDYYVEHRHQQELETMFLPGWHLIGDMTQLRHEGDFFTVRRFNRPLICWLSDGEVRTFLNVCSHRLCTITDRPRGKFDQRMTCQYHGWQFDAAGNTCRIPDAKSFRPLTKQRVQLKQFRTETVGQLIFVTFNEEAPSLAEYLGEPAYGLCQEWFSDEYRPTANFDEEFPCNWKVIVENVLESYHIDTLHTKTFVRSAPEHDCTHIFRTDGDEFQMDYSQWGASRPMEWAISKWVGQQPGYRWHHVTRYPNLVIANSSLVSFVQAVVPITPTRSLNMFRAFHWPGRRAGLRSWLADKMLRVGARRFVGRVLREDGAVYPHVQAGVASPDRPGDGLISVREERIFAFQEFVLRSTGRGSEDPPVTELPRDAPQRTRETAPAPQPRSQVRRRTSNASTDSQ